MEKHMETICVIIGVIICVLLIALCIFSIPTKTVIPEVTTGVTESIPETTVETTIIPETEETTPIETVETLPEPTEPTETIVYSDDIDPSDLEYLAIVIFQEAGGDAYCDECRRRVADVVLNRVDSPRYPNNIHDVLTQPYQYGRLHWTGVVWPARAYHETEGESVERAYRIAEEVLSGVHSELYGKGYIYQAEFVQGKDNIYCCGHYFGR